MPFIEVKTIKDVFSAEEKPKIIEEITNIFGRMRGDEFAEGTWVVINELDDGNWGEGGAVLKKEFVPKLKSTGTN
ncbi:MAG: 4-oxalocrotonate tautomerase [Gammaproteobacteria bacterium]|nr:4-oxalocrotonate tautomerase [Gammaproteobacteria bacterium]